MGSPGNAVIDGISRDVFRSLLSSYWAPTFVKRWGSTRRSPFITPDMAVEP
jgi:hypothetical protein